MMRRATSQPRPTPKGQVTTHQYDDANRLTRTTIGTKTITYAYNDAGVLAGYADGTLTGTIELDELHRKRAETVDFGAFSHTYRYRYHARGTKSALVYPDGTEAAYTAQEAAAKLCYDLRMLYIKAGCDAVIPTRRNHPGQAAERKAAWENCKKRADATCAKCPGSFLP